MELQIGHERLTSQLTAAARKVDAATIATISLALFATLQARRHSSRKAFTDWYFSSILARTVRRPPSSDAIFSV